jgi:putative ABC transport system permease protein
MMVLVVFVGLYRFRIEDGFNKACKIQSGHIQIHALKYAPIEEKYPLDIPILEKDSILEIIKTNPGVVMAASRIEFSAYIVIKGERFACIGAGIDPNEELKFIEFEKTIVNGRFLKENDEGVVIGHMMAKKFGLKTGESIRLILRNKYGAPNVLDAEIVGIISTGFMSIDNSTVYITKNLADDYLTMDGEITEIMIGLNSPDNVESTIKFITEKLPLKITNQIVVESWQNFQKALIIDVNSDVKFLGIFFTILIIVSIFTMTNTMSMSIFERTKEIGTLRAIGVEKKTILTLFSLEAALVGFAGSLLGIIAGGFVCFIINLFGLPVPGVESFNAGLASKFFVYSSPIEFIGAIVIGPFAGYIGGIKPAIRASQMRVVDCLKN